MTMFVMKSIEEELEFQKFTETVITDPVEKMVSYYIFEHGHLPKNNIKSIDSAHPAYPYAFPILIGIINKKCHLLS